MSIFDSAVQVVGWVLIHSLWEFSIIAGVALAIAGGQNLKRAPLA